ncbi:HugZ family protein [Aquabacter spiritensis]|uniref:Uncharacterized protein n=1 Tax=Aquabacter spiritensis TaxID=933073 RepID=A0A4R3M7N4_9HYPH|nr:DUF2470 domain-containing protein [Aquabacter spiritensis]TCT08289.1 hypothetical protein EDC64_101812 [Aquabacter spiritensis]
MQRTGSTEPAATALRLVQEARFGALATRETGGAPYVSLVSVAPDAAGAPILLLSNLARHTRNVREDARVSLLITASGVPDGLMGARVSALGRIGPIVDADARARFLARHPDAADYADFADFAFYRMAVEEAHLVAGFGRISTLPGSCLATDWSGAEAVRAAEADIVAHMNADHSDAIDLYAGRLLAASGTGWRMLALDPGGCDLMREGVVRRLDFPHRVTSVAAVREALVALAQVARS